MADDTKPPRTPNVPPAPPVGAESDPADVFKRGKPAIEPDEIQDPPRPAKGPKASKGAKAPPREPKPETPPDDPPMDPLDAAAEIIGLTDNLFAAVAAIRDYDKIALPNGKMLLELVAPDDAKKERLKKALARMMKTANVPMSPAVGLFLAGFTCYGAPIIAMEMARASVKSPPQ